MAIDHIRYDILAQAALRGVVRTVLEDAAKKGLPGEHHFKITFNTAATGVRLSERMRAQFPEVMTIILQHQFWDLAVSDDAFEVGLSFGGVAERLAVPFDAVTAFYDPAVEFGFQFETIKTEAESSPSAKDAMQPMSTLGRVSGEEHKAGAEPQAKPDGAAGGGEVVRFDRFRKK
jgi:hypothetical protein